MSDRKTLDDLVRTNCRTVDEALLLIGFASRTDELPRKVYVPPVIRELSEQERELRMYELGQDKPY
jgi:hypothetical protein